MMPSTAVLNEGPPSRSLLMPKAGMSEHDDDVGKHIREMVKAYIELDQDDTQVSRQKLCVHINQPCNSRT